MSKNLPSCWTILRSARDRSSLSRGDYLRNSARVQQRTPDAVNIGLCGSPRPACSDTARRSLFEPLRADYEQAAMREHMDAGRMAFDSPARVCYHDDDYVRSFA